MRGIGPYIEKGRLVHNFISDSSNFDSTTQHDFTVPTGKRWIVLGAMVKPDASATVNVTWRDSSDNLLAYLISVGAGTANLAWPHTTTTNHFTPGWHIILDAGDYIRIAFGAAQGAGAYIACPVIEIGVTA